MRLEVQGLNFSYGSSKVLTDIDLDIERSGLVCIVGPNGVGKSTLVKCILGINKPSSGRILIDGKDVSEMDGKERSRLMGYVPVGYEDAFAMTVVDSVMMGRHPHQKLGGSPSELDWKIVKRALNMMKVADLAMKGTNELSAGQHQRVAIAKGLAQTPRILILDEPTANLDPRHQLQVTARISEIARNVGMTVIMVSHDLNTSAKYADEVIMMALPGIIHSVGTPEEVLTEDSIKSVYGVECRVIDDRGRPHVILERALEDDEIDDPHVIAN